MKSPLTISLCKQTPMNKKGIPNVTAKKLNFTQLKIRTINTNDMKPKIHELNNFKSSKQCTTNSILMKYLFLLISLFLVHAVEAQIIDIPDANFKAKLLAASSINTIAFNANASAVIIDTNNDGEIQVAEALLIEKLNVSSSSIVNIKGIEAFINLKKLNFSQNQISSVDLVLFNQFTQLTELLFNNNQITILSNINQLLFPILYTLDFSDNLLTSLDISGISISNFSVNNNNLTTLTAVNSTITEFYCVGNDLVSVDLSGSQFGLLYLSNNLLTSIDLSTTIVANSLSISNNKLTSLNITSSLFGGILYCANNLFVTLDLSNVYSLTYLYCDQNPLLTFLNIKTGNPSFESVYFPNSPTLEYICTDENRVTAITALANPSTLVGSYCSFTPGGNYNTITGTIKYDDEDNGCDVDDFAQLYTKILISDTTNSGSSFIDSFGNYKFYAQTGNYTITPEVQNPTYFTVSPASINVNFPVVENVVQIENFCITPNGNHPDLEIILTPIFAAIPGNDATYKLIYKNKGNQAQSGSINLSFDDSKTDFVSALPTPINQGLNSLIWTYSSLRPFETREIYLTLNVNSPIETPAVNADDVLNFTASINFAEGDETPSDNLFNLNQVVVNSQDPNNKICLQGKRIEPDRIGDYLHYNINFENVGTNNAINIVIKDNIDITKLDMSSLQLLYASDALETKVVGNQIEFIFKNINLPSAINNPIGGHGNVLFKIRTLPTLVAGDEVANEANIYFDYNGPILTPEARTTFGSLSKDIFTRDESITVYPNPTTSKITIKAKNDIQSMQLFDVQGRILETVLTKDKTLLFDFSYKSNGVYLLKITTNKGSKVEKLVKE